MHIIIGGHSHLHLLWRCSFQGTFSSFHTRLFSIFIARIHILIGTAKYEPCIITTHPFPIYCKYLTLECPCTSVQGKVAQARPRTPKWSCTTSPALMLTWQRLRESKTSSSSQTQSWRHLGTLRLTGMITRPDLWVHYRVIYSHCSNGYSFWQ